VAVFIGQQLVDIAEKPFLLILNQGRSSVFGRKDKMVKNLRMCAHKSVDKKLNIKIIINLTNLLKSKKL
jgi:hypothetical protein